MYQPMTFVEVVACSIILRMRAASVNESSVEVKDLIHTLPSNEFEQIVQTLSKFNSNTSIQLSNNFGNEACIISWRLFLINRSFILTTAGVVRSYGVILTQLGK